MKDDARLSPTLVDLLQLRASDQADEIAYSFLREDGSRDAITYGQLDRRARAIGSYLVDAGLAGSRVVLLYPHGLEYIATFFGCLYAGAVAVPAYPPRPRRPMQRVKAILGDADGRAVLTTSELLSQLEQRVEQDIRLRSLRWIASDQIESERSGVWTRPQVAADSLALLQYTSGSTGDPKGVMISHGNLLHNLAAICQGFSIQAGNDVGVTWLPIYHDMGLVGGILEPMFVGRPAILLSPVSFLKRPQLWLATISRYRGTISGGPNFAYQLCIDRITDDQLAGLDLSSWTTAYCGAEPIRWDTLRRFARKFERCGFRFESFYPCFGLAEATLIVTGGVASAAPEAIAIDKAELAADRIRILDSGDSSSGLQSVSCGRGLMGQQVRIVNPESHIEQRDRKVGEVWVRGPGVAMGYWRRESLSRESFQARLADTGEGPFLRTGDLGFIHNQQLHITGRLKDLIIIRGRNHYPQDIEETVESSHDSLRSGGCAAFSIDSDGASQLVVVQEIERSAGDADFTALLEVIRKAVAGQHEVEPHAIVLIKALSLPKTSSGKGQRHRCRQRYFDGGLAVVAQWRRGEPCESTASSIAANPTRVRSQRPGKRQITEWLTAALADRLSLSPAQIDPHQPYESFGLDSVSAVSICGDLESWLGRTIQPGVMYQFSNVAALAAHLADDKEDITPAQPDAAQAYDEPIAIVGMGCRFPGGVVDPESYWKLLADGVDAIAEVPADRWDVDAHYDADPNAVGKMSTRWGGFIDDVDRFDASFFGITPREAQTMDPQQRLLLEVTWEALENAGLSPTQLAESSTGVFTGICNNDYSRLQQAAGGAETIDAYAGTGCAFSVTAGRISYLLNLRGPSLPVDTACSSSLVAVHLACQSLLRRECRVALASGVNLMLSPETTVYFSKVRAMAADGRCKAFDEAADGYVRGEGCGVVVLKRLSAAVADGDTVLAVIRGSAVNHDGASNGLTAPNPGAQQQVISRALSVAGVDAADVGYVETHGTGTPLGDPIEIQALAAALSLDDRREKPLMLGSVKTNIGHLEAAAGIAGLIKSVLAMRHREIPPMLHLRRLNPQISVNTPRVAFPTERAAWRSARPARIAGISSFGFSGTNAHIILQEAPTFSATVASKDRRCHLFALSAKTPQALGALVRKYRDHLMTQPKVSLADVCHTAGAGRSHFRYRLAVACESIAELVDKLTAYPSRDATDGVHWSQAAQRPLNVALAFPSVTSLDWNLVRQLDQTWPVFRQAIEACDQTLDGKRYPSIRQQVTSDVAPGKACRGATGPVATFTIQYAVAQLWRSWGVDATAVMGSGIGRITAACVGGRCSLQEALRLAMDGASDVPPVSAASGRFDFVIDVNASFAEPLDWPFECQGNAKRLPCRPPSEVHCDWLLDSLAQLYVAGLEINWPSLDGDQPRRRVVLPNYPFERERHWIKTPAGESSALDSSPEAISSTEPASRSAVEADRLPDSSTPDARAVAGGGSSDEDLVVQILNATEMMRPGLMLVYLRRQIATVMEVEESALDPDEDLVDGGLDSLMAMEVIEQVQSDFDFNLFPRELYQRPTISGLAAYLATELKRCQGDPQPGTNHCASQTPQGVKTEVAARPESTRDSVMVFRHRPSPRPALSGPPIEDCVILLTAPRSGSTLLRVMMAGHTELFSPPELHLLPFDAMAERQQVLADSYLGEGLLRAVIELEKTDAQSARQLVADWVRDDLPVDEVYRVLKRLAGPRMLVDKSPTTTGNLETMQRAETWFDSPKYIFLTRHPDAVIESLLRMRFDKLAGTTQHPHLWAEQVWMEAQRNASRFLDAVEPERKCVVQFETLVAQPEATMRRLAAFLGVPYQQAMVTPYSGQRMTDGITANARPIDDPNFLRHDRIDPTTANAWLDRPRPWQLSTESIQVAEQLGYQVRNGEGKAALIAGGVAVGSSDLAGSENRGDTKSQSGLVSMREHVIDANRRSLCCCSWGSDQDPTVLCLHGILDQGMTWSLVAERLVRRGFHVIAPDFSGHGRSGHVGAGGSYRLMDFLSDADAVLRTLARDRVLLAGHSMGAVVAAQLALARPERIERLIAIEPPQLEGSRWTLQQQLAAFLDQVAADSIHVIMDTLEAAVDRLQRVVPALSSEFAARLARRVTRQTAEGWVWRWDPRLRSRTTLSLATEQLGRATFGDLTSQLTIPTTVLIGAYSTHRRTDPGQRSEYETVDSLVIDGGHHLTVESADQVAAVIEGRVLAQR